MYIIFLNFYEHSMNMRRTKIWFIYNSWEWFKITFSCFLPKMKWSKLGLASYISYNIYYLLYNFFFMTRITLKTIELRTFHYFFTNTITLCWPVIISWVRWPYIWRKRFGCSLIRGLLYFIYWYFHIFCCIWCLNYSQLLFCTFW